MTKTYRQPILIRVIAWGYILAATPAGLICFWAWGQDSSTDSSALLGPLLLMGSFYAGAWGVIWHYRGDYRLTEESITLRQWGRQTTLRYQDICAIKELNSQWLPYLQLVTPHASLSISNKTEGFADLYATLRERVPALRATEEAPAAIHLRLDKYYLMAAGVGFGVYAVFTGILSMGGVWGQPNLTWKHGLGAWGLFLLIAIFGWLVNEWGEPYDVSFTPTHIEARYVLGKTRRWPTTDLTGLERQRQLRDGRPGVRREVHPLVLTFTHGPTLQLEEERIWAFGYSPERLLVMLTGYFNPQPRRK
jgi:hypothetical protein